MNLKYQRNFDADGDEREKDRDRGSQAISCWSRHAIIAYQNRIDVPEAARYDAALQYGEDDVEEQSGCVEEEHWRASLVVFGEEHQDKEENQAGAELDGRDNAMNDRILDQGVDIPQRKLAVLSVTIGDGDVLLVDLRLGGYEL